MNHHVLNILITALVIVFAIILFRVVGKLWKPSIEAPHVKILGAYSPLLTWLKYRRIPRMVFQPANWVKIRKQLLAAMEVVAIILWGLWLGRQYLVMDSTEWMRGDWLLNVQGYFALGLLDDCGACALWDGFFNGGAPIFADIMNATTHPLAVTLILLGGAVNGTKLIAVAGMILSGVAQWTWAKVMRLSWLPRMWGAALATVGGYMVGRLEGGLSEIMLSIASFSLVIAIAIHLHMTGKRRVAIILGVCTGLAFLSGQGYMQLAFLVGICPAFFILLIDKQFKVRPVWKEFALAAGIAILVSAVLWVPAFHILPGIYKPATTVDFQSVQPIEYQPLNLVIRDYTYYGTESLQKLPWTSFSVNYIGWVAVILALLSLRFIPRAGLRIMVFLWASIFLIYTLSSALLMKGLVTLMPTPFESLLTQARFPAFMAGLAAPLIIVLASWGLDLLLKLKWPKLTLHLSAETTITLSLAWLVIIPLVGSIRDSYLFVKPWLEPVPSPADAKYYELTAEIQPETIQWVEPPYGDFGFWIAALENGIKITNVYHHFNWKDRTPPVPYVRVTRDEVDPGAPNFVGKLEYLSLFSYPENQYAYVDTGDQQIPCQATALGGNIDVTCDTDTPGQLVVIENYWNGWKATRDGEKAVLGDGAWLTTEAPAGEHQYAFRYRPWDVSLGGALSLLGIGLAAWLWAKAPKEEEPEKTDREA